MSINSHPTSEPQPTKPIRQSPLEVRAFTLDALATCGWIGGILVANVTLGDPDDNYTEARALVADIINNGASVGTPAWGDDDGVERRLNARLRRMQAEGRDVREVRGVGGAA